MKTIITSLILILFAQIGQGQTNWTIISQPGVNFIIVNETTGYSYINEAVGSHGAKYTLKKSTDSFKNFTTIKTKTGDFGCYSLDEMFYIDSYIGFIAELCQGLTSIYKTVDGGQNWINMGFGGTYGLSMYFLNDSLGYYSFFPGGSNNSYLMQSGTQVFTTNKYIFANYDFPNPYYTTKIKFINDSTGFIICKDTLDNAVILKTSDFGYNWSEVKVLNNNLFKDIIFINDSVGIVVGTNGIILKSNNLGQDWQTINSNTSNTLNSIDFSNDGISYIVGENGLILKSQDFGNTWSQVSFMNTNDLIYVRVFNNEYVYINDSNGILFSNHDNSSVSEIIYNHFKIYPNPVKEILNISIHSEIKNYNFRLYDLHGNRILSSNDNSFNLKNIASGIYVFEIEIEQGIFREKIIKQ